MTTTEPLQFSVISAPVAAIDRRALSQAWYSALYHRTTRPENTPAKTHSAAAARGRQRLDAPSQRKTVIRANAPALPAASQQPNDARAAAGLERRGARSVLARKIERVFLQPHKPPKTATFRIEGVPGRVHIVLRSGGRGLQLVAVCSRHARVHVAAALAQARYALALRGIAMDARVSCAEAVC